MAIRDHRRRAALLGLISAGLAAVAIIGGLAPAALADGGYDGSCTLNSPSVTCSVTIAMVDAEQPGLISDGQAPQTTALSDTIPWQSLLSQPFNAKEIQLYGSADVGITGPCYDDQPTCGYLSISMDGTTLSTDDFGPVAAQPDNNAIDPLTYPGNMIDVVLSSTQLAALPYGEHTFVASFPDMEGTTYYSTPINVTLAPPPDGTVIQDRTTGQVSVVVGGQRIVLPGTGTMSMSEINQIPDSAYQSLPVATGPQLAEVPSGKVYEILGNLAIPFSGSADLAASGLAADPVYDVPAAVISAIGTPSEIDQLPPGTPIRDNVTGTDSVIVSGAPIPFASPAEIAAAGLSPSQFADVPPSYFTALPTTPGARAFVQGDASSQIYQIWGGEDKNAVSAALGGSPVVVVSQSWLDSLHTMG
jgi:hypothetical protein